MCACGSTLAWECGPPSWPPGSGASALREDHPEALFSGTWEQSARDAGKVGLPRGGSSSQPVRVLTNWPFEAAGEIFQRERAASAQRTYRSEAEPSMAPALGQPCQTFLASSGTAT